MKPAHLLCLVALLSFPLFAADNTGTQRPANPYPPGPDSQPQEGVPKGERIKGIFDQSKIFPGTTRDYTIYIPTQLDRSKPAPFMVLQDGGGYRADVVFDNLIHKKEVPALIGLFVNHGRVKALNTNATDRFNRSYEYDGLGDNYARFLLEEFFPFIEQKHGIKLSSNPNDGSIGGASSGAICAFTAAWERPDRFRRVFSSIGTYVGLRGGNAYPTLIRKTEPKPFRIFLQDGENDLNIYGGDWWMANQEMERALVFAGYDVNHAWGNGAHDGNQSTQVFPDALRWLWRDYPAEIKPNPEGKSKQPVAKLLGGDWELISEGHGFTEGPAVNAKGEVFFTDIPRSRIHKITVDGKVSVFAEDTGNANGLMFGPDGRLYAASNGKKQIVAYDENGKSSVVVEEIESNDLAVGYNGNLYVTDPGHKQVWLVTPKGEKRVVDANEKGGLQFPNGVRLAPDQSLLYVADMRGQFIWSYQVAPDGGLAYKQQYFHLHQPDALEMSAADGMCLDTNGALYVATAMGVQFCDQAGRVNGIISRPQNKWLANVVFGGANFDELYACCSDKVYKRKLNTRGANSFQPPVKPPMPRL
jgi:sugar lactone lactonase YvrE/enterochelin esterase-like enzyme